MNKCKVCGIDCNGNTCSGSCRAKLSRRTRTEPSARSEAHAVKRTVSVTDAPERYSPDDEPAFDVVLEGSLSHYQSNPDMYVTRLEPVRLNWDTWMDLGELNSNKLKANRVSIPGDWDYA
jgi:hypothetical protein